MDNQNDISIRIPAAHVPILVDALAIAQWVVCAGEEFEDGAYQEVVNELQQSIFRQTHEAGFTDAVYKADDGDFYHATFMEDESVAWRAFKFHEEETFWEELIHRFSSVLAIREVDPKIWEERSQEENFVRICLHENRVREALRRHGLHGLFLVSANFAE